MYKYFAKTLFLGKKVDYLTQCHSTNEELAKRIRIASVSEGDLIVTGFQTKGKGQRGNAWLSDPDKNLLFSLCLKPTFLELKNLYLINVLVGLALRKTLDAFMTDHKIEIKWPNDIYSDDSKIGGVLVESVLGGNRIENVIVGIGLNVNQDYFALNNATSMKRETGDSFDLDAVMEVFLLSLEAEYIRLKSGAIKNILFEYHQAMRWRGEIHLYKAASVEFEGEIIGINDKGKLMVKHNNQLSSYDVKEIGFIR